MSWYEITLKDPDFSYAPSINKSASEIATQSMSQFGGLEYLYLLFIMLSAVVMVIWILHSLLSKEVRAWRVAVIPMAVLLCYSSFFVMMIWNVPLIEIPEVIRKGEFGDSFGTLNALFSGLAFAGVIITILIQKVDLADVRRQSSKQQVESQFYNILNLQQQVIQGFDLHLRSGTPHAKTVQGRDCFREWRRTLKHRYDDYLKHSYRPIEASVAAYDSVLQSHLGDLGLYFRSLYGVFRFIEGLEGVDGQEQKKYAVIVRSLLSDFELLFLFYNCLSTKGEKFMRFAKAYSLFDNLNVQLLMDVEDVAAMSYEVYGDNGEALALLEYLNS